MAESSITAAAGEYYVMSELLRRGLIAALAPRGVPNTDLVVTDKIGDQLCAVQVKSRLTRPADGGWHMKAKHEEIVSRNIYYVFVCFGSQPPDCWIVPSAVVAKALKVSHQHWLALPGRAGQAHKDGAMRRFRSNYKNLELGAQYPEGWLDKYRNAWSLLEKAAMQ
jgi:hypothetical protein